MLRLTNAIAGAVFHNSHSPLPPNPCHGLSAEFPGLWQINVRVPDAPSVAKQVPVFVIGDGGAVSNGVSFWVED